MFTSLQIKRSHGTGCLPLGYLATDNEVNQIAYNVQETSVSQCTSAYHCQIKNSSLIVVDIAASSVAWDGGGGGLWPPLCHVDNA